jgi:predicted DNA-binding protein
MTVTLDVPKEIEARLLADAQARGVPVSEFMRDFIIEHYEEAEDRFLAESGLDDPQAPISASQLRKNLGLDS